MKRAPPLEGLRAILGDAAADLEHAWLTGSTQERAEIETFTEILRLRVARDGRPLLDPPDADQADGPLRIGRVQHGERQLGWFGLHPDDLCHHALVIGRSGSGKSTLAVGILKSLSQLDRPWCAFDHKRSLRALVALGLTGEVHVVTLGRDIGASLRFNPLSPPPGVPAESHQKLVVESLCRAWFAGDGVAALLLRAIRKTPYDHPTFVDVRQAVETMALKDRESLWRQSAIRILEQLTTGHLGRVLNSRRDARALDRLLSCRTVVELDGLNTKDTAFLISCITRHLSCSLLAGSQREQLRLAVFVDEAHHLLTKTDSSLESPIETALREGREAGLGLILATQTFSGLSPVAIANAATLLVMHSTHRSDINAGASGLLLKDDQRELLALLRVGEAVGRKAQGWTRPVLLRIPPQPIPKGQVRDDDVRRMFLLGPFASKSLDERQIEPPGGVPADPGRSPEAEGRRVDVPAAPTSDEREQDSDPQARSVVASKSSSDRTIGIAHDPDAMRFLEHVHAEPFMGVAERYRDLGVSKRRGDALKRSLIAEGFLRSVSINTGRARTLLLDLAEQGRQTLAQRGVTTTLPNASLVHRYWQHRIATQIRGIDWGIATEVSLDGHAFDVVGTRGAERVLVEVETGKSNWLLNLEALERTPADHKAVFWLDPQSLGRARASAPSGIAVLRPSELGTWLQRLR